MDPFTSHRCCQGYLLYIVLQPVLTYNTEMTILTILNWMITSLLFTQRFRSKILCDCFLTSTNHTDPRDGVERGKRGERGDEMRGMRGGFLSGIMGVRDVDCH
jgi:hypothetical protein